MSKKRVIKNAAQQIDSLIKYLEDKYASQGYKHQFIEIVDQNSPGKLFQVRNETKSKWITTTKNLTGLGNAGTIKILKQGNDIEIEVFGGKWLDKAAVAGVSMIVLWPLFITASIGAWKQNKLLSQLYEDVMLYFAEHSQSEKVVSRACSNCGAVTTPAMKFCGGCGKQLQHV